ncbi:hypothetical protein [Georhizobium profundi]|uniref:hypothetical protein n=1 Tax=Georhizobium profundi TaxID=2341112 RepID=UPI00196B456E|nr:hypothetical protein [Georhizobium profundi]
MTTRSPIRKMTPTVPPMNFSMEVILLLARDDRINAQTPHLIQPRDRSTRPATIGKAMTQGLSSVTSPVYAHIDIN